MCFISNQTSLAKDEKYLRFGIFSLFRNVSRSYADGSNAITTEKIVGGDDEKDIDDESVGCDDVLVMMMTITKVMMMMTMKAVIVMIRIMIILMMILMVMMTIKFG